MSEPKCICIYDDLVYRDGTPNPEGRYYIEGCPVHDGPPPRPGLTDEVLEAVNKGRAMRGQPPLEGRGPSFCATDEELANLDDASTTSSREHAAATQKP